VVLVFAQIRKVEPEPAKQRPVIPLKHAVEAPDDRPFKARKKALRIGCRL
jgi:hypothetical protein